ncbi:MAG: hypothetical protein AB7D57_03080 [Desulfovibrionaceae bacterium]
MNVLSPRTFDIAEFRRIDGVFAHVDLMMVVKSQNQSERRANMLASLKDGKWGRSEQRDISIGLLARGHLAQGAFQEQWRREYREPRHFRQHGAKALLTEVNRVVELDAQFQEAGEIRHPFFAFLHTVDISADGRRILVTSSGYDRLMEFEATDHGYAESWSWVGWRHGFNPDENGLWVTDDKAEQRELEAKGIACRFVDPKDHGEQGLLTSERTVHPNVAVYDPHDGERSILLSCGKKGELYRVDRSTGDVNLVCDSLHCMPHGLVPYRDGWAATDTTVGRWCVFDRDFRPLAEYLLRTLPGKPAYVGPAEWVQQCIPYEDGFLALDANRGLLAVDLSRRCYSVYSLDPEWCVQDVQTIDAPQDR